MNRQFVAAASTVLVIFVSVARSTEDSHSANRAEVDYGPVISKVHDAAQQELERGILTGVSIALVDEDHLVMADGFGWADKQQQKPAAATTVYRVGSISKLFTAVAAMQLVEQGKLDIDAPVSDALSEFRIVLPFEESVQPTLRQMMCHRSGMVRESPVGGYFDGSGPTVSETIASLESCVLVNLPNTKTRYSNVGPTIVGHTVSKVSGQPFEDYQSEHLFAPLGMQHSGWRAEAVPSELLANSYMRVADGQGGFVHRPSPRFELGTLPAGNLYSTAVDLAQFAKMILAKGRVPDGRVIQAETLREMCTPQLIEDSTGFGIGFYVGEFADRRTIQHTGAVYGFSSSLVVIPEEGIAAIVLANEDVAMGPVRHLSNVALAAMLETKTDDPPTPEPERLQLSHDALQAFVGAYESESYWAEVTYEAGKILANISGQPMRLDAIESLKFEANGRTVYRAKVSFQKNEAGEVSGFTALGQQFRRVTAQQVHECPTAWQSYLGSYGPEFIPLVISIRHGHLYAMTENMYDYRLKPINQFVFGLPEGLYADEYLVFQVDEDGRVGCVDLANMRLPRWPNQRSD
jgi:CubicO group peptidase (beta-lactamase class C family)